MMIAAATPLVAAGQLEPFPAGGVSVVRQRGARWTRDLDHPAGPLAL